MTVSLSSSTASLISSTSSSPSSEVSVLSSSETLSSDVSICSVSAASCSASTSSSASVVESSAVVCGSWVSDGICGWPVIVSCNSERSICPSPSSSMVLTRRSTCDGGRSARFKLSKPVLSSVESMRLSPFVSNFLNNVGMSIPVTSSHLRRTSTTSSATKIVPQWMHFVESRATRPWHAPHSPSDSSETPENEMPHSGQFSESSGTIDLHAPHSAIGTSSFVPSVISTPVIASASSDIMIHRL